jgi:hypothetical protein
MTAPTGVKAEATAITVSVKATAKRAVREALWAVRRAS